MRNRDQLVSFLGVVLLALMLPAILRLTNSVVRFFVGAEGRLAAIAVETDHPLGPLPQPWKALAQGGVEVRTFLDENPEEVASASPQYIRIDHIYDQFNVVSRSGSQLVFNWEELDRVVQQITTTGAKPFLSLSYMPPVLTGGDILAEPKDWEEWALVVQKTVEHYSGELGIEGVYYEVWNEPDLFGEWKMGGKKDYKNLYLVAARGAGRAAGVKEFKLGGAATTGLYKNWIDNFFPFVMQNNLRLDFYSWHRYDLDTNKYLEDVENIEAWTERHPYFSRVEKILTEFGPVSKAGGENDTKTGAAHLVAVMRELMFKVKYGFIFSVAGETGIIGKPRYEALMLLNQLGPERLAITGEGSWVKAIGAKKGNKYQVLLTNYDKEDGHAEVVPVSFINLKNKNYILRRIPLGGQITEQQVATTEAILQRDVPMTANSVILVELEPVVEAVLPTPTGQ